MRNIQYLAKGGFSTIYKAILLDGPIYSWDSKNKQLKRRAYPLKNKDYENVKNENIKSPLNENEKKGFHIVLLPFSN